ncbi:MAG TPA: methyltransferase domain-containing protein [Candidatus Saccharimonadia bacterium]|nr:methyltransferase domain-containing protein [Candidatus Saccharimonadia bacterium]
MVLLAVAVLVTFAFALAGIMGAPYVPILKKQSDGVFELAHLQSGQTFIDLGCGDGRLLRSAASKGIKCIGYEINPFMVLTSRIVCWRYRKLVTVHWANLWQVTLPRADVIYVFLMPKHMPHLHALLETQITRPTTVISYAFEIPGRPAKQRTTNTFVYDYGSSQPAG